MKVVIQQLIASLQKGETPILGTIIEQSGSTPRGSGAKMLVTPDGVLHGTIGGGDVEAQCHNRARQMLQNDTSSSLLSFNLTEQEAADSGLVCGGSLQVLLYAISPETFQLFESLQQTYREKFRATLVSTIPTEGEKVQLSLINNGAVSGNALPQDLLTEIDQKSKKSRLPYSLTSGTKRYFIEPQIESGTLWLIGAGHVSQATATLASFVDFDVRVLDDRADFANKARFPEANEIVVLEDFTNCFGKLGADDYVVIITRGHAHDREVLRQALSKTPGYIGMIGSRKKREATYRKLMEDGISGKQLTAVHCPIGLAVGADTPQEIAVSIVAELVAQRAGVNK